MVKIAFESQLLINGNKTGIPWCAHNLIKGIAQQEGYSCQLNYFSKGISKDKLDNLNEYEELGIQRNASGCLKPSWYKYLWMLIPMIPYSCFFGRDAQITQFFNYAVPPGVRGKKVTIVHDMAHLACRETVRAKTKIWLDLVLKASCKRADMILTVSEFSKSEILKYLNVPEEKIRVMYPGVDLGLFHPDYSNDEVRNACRKYGINERYILYTGTIEPRKNIQRLIEAYDKLASDSDIEELPQLVLAGGKGWLCDDIYKAAENSKRKDLINFTGYVDAEDLPLLMKGAEFFCFPSLYEGFGTPPVEAMACGTPVLAADAASIPEILGGHAVYVDPLSIDSIASGMKKLMMDTELRKRMASDGLEYVKRYDWKYSVEILSGIYKELCQ
jgi:glycosyltransferase involved in cell wall biosynthesis